MNIVNLVFIRIVSSGEKKSYFGESFSEEIKFNVKLWFDPILKLHTILHRTFLSKEVI